MKNVCCGGKCKKLRHHRTSNFCFECGKKLIKKPYQWSFQHWHSLIIIVPLIGFGGPIGISSCMEYRKNLKIQRHEQVQLLPLKWQSIYYSVIQITGDNDKTILFLKLVIKDLPPLSPSNIYFLTSLFYYDSNIAKVASKIMEFRDDSSNNEYY